MDYVLVIINSLNLNNGNVLHKTKLLTNAECLEGSRDLYVYPSCHVRAQKTHIIIQYSREELLFLKDTNSSHALYSGPAKHGKGLQNLFNGIVC